MHESKVHIASSWPLCRGFRPSGWGGGGGGGQIRHTMKMYRIIEFVSLPLAEGDKLVHDYDVHEIFNLYENCEINDPWVRDLGPLFRSIMSTY